MPKNDPEVITDELMQRVQKGSAKMTEAKAVALAGQCYSQGRYKQAANVCKQLIAHKPTLADAHNILGVSLCAMGLTDQGIAAIKHAISLSPRIASYRANLGEVLRTKGLTDEAKDALDASIRLDPHNAQAHNNLGIVRYEREEYAEAQACYRKALELQPEFPEAFNNLGNALRKTDDKPGAVLAYQNALSHREIYPEAYNNLGTLLRELKKTDQAEHALKKAIAQNPRYTDAYNNLGAIYFSEGNEVEALRQMAEVLKYDPKNAKTLILTARIQTKRASYEAAEQACQIVLANEPDNTEAMTVLGQLMHETDRYEAAIALLERALTIDPEQAEASNFYGVALKSVGRLDEARDQILKALKLNPDMYGAYANLNDLIDFSKEPVLFEQIENIVKNAENPDSDQMLPMHYAYAKALDDNGSHEKALDYYISGGRLKRAHLNYNEADTFEFFDKIKKAFPPEIFTNRPFAGNDDARPVFIVGMPRSGSTLVEQIVSSHPAIFGAGEVKYLSRSLHTLRDRFPSLSRYPDMVGELTPGQADLLASRYLTDITASADGAKRVTDKLLTNYFFVGLIHLLFPKAKIINTKRDPVDTCLSAFTKLFKDDMPHSYNLEEIGRYYRQYDLLMDYWNKVLPAGVMMTSVYEDVVSDTEQSARKIIDFVGLPWNKKCLEFHKSSRPVKTASVAQVRKPIYKTAVKRWEKYGPGLKPLIDVLEGVDADVLDLALI